MRRLARHQRPAGPKASRFAPTQGWPPPMSRIKEITQPHTHELLPFPVICLSSPGLTGRSSNHRQGILDCPVKPGKDTAFMNGLTTSQYAFLSTRSYFLGGLKYRKSGGAWSFFVGINSP